MSSPHLNFFLSLKIRSCFIATRLGTLREIIISEKRTKKGISEAMPALESTPRLHLREAWLLSLLVANRVPVFHVKKHIGWPTWEPPIMLLLGGIYLHPISLMILVLWGWVIKVLPKILILVMFKLRPIWSRFNLLWLSWAVASELAWQEMSSSLIII